MKRGRTKPQNHESVLKKPFDIHKKSFIFKVELLIFERLGLVCFLEHRDFDDPGSDDLMNAESDRDEFQGPVGPEECRRTALGYAYNRLSVNPLSTDFQLLEGSSLAFAPKEQYLNNYKRYHHVRHTVGKVFSLRIQRRTVLRKTFSNA